MLLVWTLEIATFYAFLITTRWEFIK